MSELAHVHRTVDRVAEVDVVCDSLLGGWSAVAMAGVHQFVVVAGIVEHPEEAVPVGATQQDDVVLVYIANSLHTFLI